MIDDLAIRLEYYHDKNPKKPEAWHLLRENWSDRDPVEEGYKTVVLDSMTSVQLHAFNHIRYHRASVIRHAKDPRKWYGAITEEMEQLVMSQLASMHCNVVVVAHLSREKDERAGSMVYWPSAPGRLGAKGGGLPSAYAETYRAYVKTKSGENEYLLQTETSSKHIACTQIQAPNPAEPEYEGLWENWEGKHRPPIHLLVYGNAGAKKSMLAATFPQPILVIMCDAIGKDGPYLRAGKAQKMKFNRELGIYTRNVLR